MVRPPYSTRTQRYVRARAEANMLGAVQVLRRAKSAMDTTTLVVTTAILETVYAGKARIYSETQGAALFVGESVQPISAVTVSLPYDADGIHADDVVLVTSFGSDPELENDAFLVKDVGGGGLIRATRTLSCVAYQANRWWE